jgi:hypothetical protein
MERRVGLDPLRLSKAQTRGRAMSICACNWSWLTCMISLYLPIGVRAADKPRKEWRQPLSTDREKKTARSMPGRLPHRSELPGRQARGVGRSRERPWPHTNRTSSPKTSTWCFAASIPRRPLPRQDIISPTAAIASGPRCISPASQTDAFSPTRNGASSPMAAASRPSSTGPRGGPTRSRRRNSWQLGSDSRPRCVATRHARSPFSASARVDDAWATRAGLGPASR